MTKITDKKRLLIKERRREARANLAIEGIHLTSEEEALFEYMDRQRLPHDKRRELIDAYLDGKADIASIVSEK